MQKAIRATILFIAIAALSALYTNCGAKPAGEPSAKTILSVGGESSGGGNAILSPTTGKYVLLDYFTFSPALHGNYTSTPGQALVKTSYQFPEFDDGYEALPEQQPAYALLLDRLEAWATQMPDVQARLLSEVRIAFVALPDVPQAGRYDLEGLEALYPNLVVKPLACFDAERAESVWTYNTRIIYLNEPIWNQLDLASQAGLILHEMLRQLQLANAVQLTELEDGSDRALQDLTSKIMLTDPL